MAVPKRRQSKSRSRKRNSHNAVTPPQVSGCPECGHPRPSHVVCPKCGWYMGRVLAPPADE
ncbi:50S ribosomal protein L32 [Thalassoroseus pseudoceratinae]|uniref:50S ribosomal protein L32 n=1 Tax=Thalassoroseus pseudoceratinae TaxID=2713176 RepID=UPI00141E6C0B|nr:50S ribosomal protein L32 [Thalassoroseus pseudoceratinae]